MDTRDELYNLKNLIEIRSEIKKIYHHWSNKDNVKSLIIKKIRDGGEITLDEDIVGRFTSTEQAKQFLELFAVIYGYSYNRETGVLKATGASDKILESRKKREPEEFQSETIPTEEIKRVINIARGRIVTAVEDVVGYYSHQSNVTNRIRAVFREISKKEREFLFINNNILINIAQIDKKIVREEIIKKGNQNFPKSFISIGQEKLFSKEEQQDIVIKSIKRNLDMDINPNIDDAVSLLNQVFKKDENVCWENSEMRYKISVNDFWE